MTYLQYYSQLTYHSQASQISEGMPSPPVEFFPQKRRPSHIRKVFRSSGIREAIGANVPQPSNLSEGILSPTDEVLADETMLKHAYSGLQQECAQIKTKLAATKERMRLAEALVHSRDIDLHLSKVRVERAERDAAAARKELNDLKTSLLKDIEKVVMNKFAGGPASPDTSEMSLA